MKKGIIVLLIAVLISGFAFAGDFHGYAGIDFGVDLDEHTWGFANNTYGQYKFKFEFDSAKVSIGAEHQTNVWAELDAEASAYISLAPAANNPTEDLIPHNSTYTAELQPKYTAKITKANIHVGEDLTFGILNAGKAPDFATTYYKTYKAANNYKVRSYVAGDNKLVPGFTVDYLGWKGGFGAQGLWDDDSSTYEIWGWGQTQEFKFGSNEEISVIAGGYGHVGSGVDQYIGGGAKAAYATDKLAVDAAADAVIKRGDLDFGFEAALNATYDFVTLNVYAVNGILVDPTYEAATYAKYNTEDNKKAIKLDAKLSAAYTFDLNDDIALDVSGYVEAKDALIDGLLLKIGATEGTTIDAFTVELTESVALKNLANKDVDAVTELEIEAYVAYAHEKFTAYGDLMAEFLFNKVDNNDVFTNLYFEAGISSDAIVEGAELSLVYGGNARIPYYENGWVDFLDLENHKGAITASCTIPF